jgi:hypothetical protein
LAATQCEQVRNESNRRHASAQGHALTPDRKAWAKPAREREALAASRRAPRMHWRWVRRGEDILGLLEHRFGRVLPNDEDGLEAAELLAHHYMRLTFDPERITKANLRLWCPWLGAEATARIILAARGVKTPSAAKLGRDLGVTAEEVAERGLTTIRAVTVTHEADRLRQDRRKAGVSTKRGRPALHLSPDEMRARRNAQAAARMRALRKKSHAPSYIGETKRDELNVTGEKRRPPKAARRQAPLDGEIIEPVDVGLPPPPPPPSHLDRAIARARVLQQRSLEL